VLAERLPFSALLHWAGFPKNTCVSPPYFPSPDAYILLGTKYALQRVPLFTCGSTRLSAVFDNYVAEIKLDEKPVQLALWDTAYVDVLSL
jgi:hypothetical protein